MSEPKDQNEAACGGSALTAELATTVAYIDNEGSVIIVGYEAYRKTSWIDGDDRAIPASWKKLEVVDNAEISRRRPCSPRQCSADGPEPKLWLWKNFVDGKQEYWVFDNLYPININDDDPQTLGDPCGYALFKPSRNGRKDTQ